MSMSDYLENKVLAHVLGTVTYTSPGSVYLALHSADTLETGSNELTGGTYARQLCAFGAAASGSIANANQEDFTLLPAGDVKYAGIWDGSTAGNFLWGGALTATKSVSLGDTVTINAGSVVVTLD